MVGLKNWIRNENFFTNFSINLGNGRSGWRPDGLKIDEGGRLCHDDL